MPEPRPAPLHLIRPEVRNQRAYRVPTEVDAEAKLDQNESPFDLPEALKRALVEGFVATEWNRYPDDRPHRLIAALAERLDLPKESVIVGRGSIEITYSLGLCFLDRGTPVVLPHPMFALFGSVARMHAAEVVSVDPGPGLAHDADAVLAAAQRSGAALTIVTTPNAPRRFDSVRPAVRLDRTAELSTLPIRAARSARSARMKRSAGTARKISCHQLRFRNFDVEGAT